MLIQTEQIEAYLPQIYLGGQGEVKKRVNTEKDLATDSAVVVVALVVRPQGGFYEGQRAESPTINPSV